MYHDEPLISPDEFETDPSPFSLVLREAFSDQLADLAERCVIRLALEVNQADFSDVVEVIDKAGSRAELITRLRRTHPLGTLHDRQFDRHFWTVWTEAMAFAWSAQTGSLGVPEFTDDHGTPDLVIGGDFWIEAKTVERSPNERLILDQMAEASDRGVLLMRPIYGFTAPHPNLVKKFDDHHEDAIRKWNRQQSRARLIVFFGLEGFDLPTRKETAHELIRRWAVNTSHSTGTRVVIVSGASWRHPFVDTGWPTGGS